MSSKSYDLVVLCLGSNSPIYQKISGNREIHKNYKEHSITCSVKHQIKDIGAQQFFLKEGPLAILPYNKIKFSVVWSIEDKYYLRNKKLSKIIKSQMTATQNVFRGKKIPFRSFEILKRNEESLGEIFCFFILETILLGRALKVNPFDQPSVELVKKETKKILLSN